MTEREERCRIWAKAFAAWPKRINDHWECCFKDAKLTGDEPTCRELEEAAAKLSACQTARCLRGERLS